MILSFLYHKIGDGKYANSEKMLKEHLLYISQHYKTYFPGEKVPLLKLGLCLTFDDGYFDFYHIIYPLLKSLNLKAVLAISPAYILDSSTLAPINRLSSDDPYRDAKTKATFCTFEELKEMIDSPHVQIASHSYSHANLTDQNIDLQKEIVESKNILEEKLGAKINTFVYPYGKFNKEVHKLASDHYSCIMRIGGAINYSWQNTTKLFYRIVADELKSPKEPFKSYYKYYLRLLLNIVRYK